MTFPLLRYVGALTVDLLSFFYGALMLPLKEYNHAHLAWKGNISCDPTFSNKGIS